MTHATGDFARNFPGVLGIDVSVDGTTWERAWEGSTAAEAFLAYVREPRIGRLASRLPPGGPATSDCGSSIPTSASGVCQR